MVRDFATAGQKQQIKRMLKVLGHDFALSQNPNSRKGGLIGLAATSIALGKVGIVVIRKYCITIPTLEWCLVFTFLLYAMYAS